MVSKRAAAVRPSNRAPGDVSSHDLYLPQRGGHAVVFASFHDHQHQRGGDAISTPARPGLTKVRPSLVRGALIAVATLLILIGIGQLLAHTTRSSRPVLRSLTPAALPGSVQPTRPSTPHPSQWISTREAAASEPAVERSLASAAPIRLLASSAEGLGAPRLRERSEQPIRVRVPKAKRATNDKRSSALELPIAPPED